MTSGSSTATVPGSGLLVKVLKIFIKKTLRQVRGQHGDGAGRAHEQPGVLGGGVQGRRHSQTRGHGVHV